MHYLLFYNTIEGYIEKRAPYREEHLNSRKPPETTEAW